MADHAPSFRYHATEAPAGKLFKTLDELDALGPEWVDTPAKFPAVEAGPVDEPPDHPAVEALEPLRRRRKSKD